MSYFSCYDVYYINHLYFTVYFVTGDMIYWAKLGVPGLLKNLVLQKEYMERLETLSSFSIHSFEL